MTGSEDGNGEGLDLEREAAIVRLARDPLRDPVYGDIAHKPLVRLHGQVTVGDDRRVVVCPECGADHDFGLSASNRLYCRCGRWEPDNWFTDEGMDPRISKRIVSRYMVRGNSPDEGFHGDLSGRVLDSGLVEIEEDGVPV